MEENQKPEVEYLCERISRYPNDIFLVEGQISSIKVKAHLLRQHGGAYTGDGIDAEIEYVADYLPCDFAMRLPDSEIEREQSSIGIVREVTQRLAKELGAIVRAAMTEHAEALREELTKEVATKTNSTTKVRSTLMEIL